MISTKLLASTITAYRRLYGKSYLPMDKLLVITFSEQATCPLSTPWENYIKNYQMINAYLKLIGNKPVTYNFSTNKEKIEEERQKMENEKPKMEYQKLKREQKQNEEKLKREDQKLEREQKQKEEQRKREDQKLKWEQKQKEEQPKREEKQRKREEEEEKRKREDQKLKIEDQKLKWERRKFFIACGMFISALDQVFGQKFLRKQGIKLKQFLFGSQLKNCLKELKEEVPTQFTTRRYQLDQASISKYGINQIYYQTSVSKQIQSEFQNLSNDTNQKITVLFGLPGIGKSSAIIQQVNKRKNGNEGKERELIFYLHSLVYAENMLDNTKGEAQNIKGNDIIDLLWKHPTINQISKIIKNPKMYSLFYRKEEKQIYDAINSKKGITIILDEFNSISQKPFDSKNYMPLIAKLHHLQINGVKVLLVSSNQAFCYQQLVSVSTLRADKFNVVQIKSNKKQDFDQMFNDFNISQKAKQMILKHHYNRRDMKGALTSYLGRKGNESEKLSALEAHLKAELGSKTTRLHNLIKSKKGNYKQYLESICLAYKPQKCKEPTEGVTEILSYQNIVDYGEFCSKIQMKAFEQYAKQFMGKQFKCKSQKFYQM